MNLHVQSLPLEQIDDYFKNHQESLRIKKLIFYTVKNYWENDQSLLNKLNLKPLILELKTINPTLEDTKKALLTAVASLNRQEAYAEITKVIVAKLAQIYDDDEVTAEISSAVNSKQEVSPEQLKQIINRLENNQEAERIKKIIFYISKKYWEHDINVVETVGLTSLIQQIKKEFHL